MTLLNLYDIFVLVLEMGIILFFPTYVGGGEDTMKMKIWAWRFVIAFVIGTLLSFAVAFGANAQAYYPRPGGPGSPEYAMWEARNQQKMQEAQLRHPSRYYGDGYSYGREYGDFTVRTAIAYDLNSKRKFATVAADLAYQAGQAGVSKLAQKLLGSDARYGGQSGAIVFVDVPAEAKVYLDGEYVGRGKSLNGKKIKFIAGSSVEVKVVSPMGEIIFYEPIGVLPKHTTTVSP